MKRLIYFVALILCFSLTSCGVLVDTDTPLSSELSEKYTFYKNSVAAIRSGCNVSSEEADAIFLVLVENCGANSEITVTPYVNKPYEVKWSSKTYAMTLDGNTVASVLDGESQIYPATAAAAQPEETEEVAATEAPEESAEAVPDDVFDFSASDIPFGEVDTGELKLQYGKLLSVIYNDGIVVVKAKIKPNLTNKLTIGQNYFNVGDLIKKHGFNTCEELQYWAVADMTSGDEVKVISFDLNKDTIDKLYSEKIFESQLEDYVDNLFIHISLQK